MRYIKPRSGCLREPSSYLRFEEMHYAICVSTRSRLFDLQYYVRTYKFVYSFGFFCLFGEFMSLSLLFSLKLIFNVAPPAAHFFYVSILLLFASICLHFNRLLALPDLVILLSYRHCLLIWHVLSGP